MDTRLARISPNELKQEAPEPEGGWKIDRKIPVALLFALVLQSAAVVWWAARLDSRVEALEAQRTESVLLLDRVTRIEEKMLGLKEAIGRVEGKLGAGR